MHPQAYPANRWATWCQQASGDPVACFDELSSPIYLPPPFQSRQYDPQSPALVYLLLHDWCRGAALGVDPDRVLSQVRGVMH